MFHFPALPPAALSIQAAATPHDGGRVPPFGNPRITAWLPAPRGISQAPASFIGSWCQGIHRVPCKTWHDNHTTAAPQGDGTASASQKQEMLASTVQFSRNGRQPARREHPPGPARQKKPAPAGARSLRTQQRAPPATAGQPVLHHEQWAPAGTPAPRDARCSLERR
jgi:hypothetical protein